MWVARDRDDSLTLAESKPYIADSSKGFYKHTGHYFEINSSLFPNLKWEDEPLEVELVEAKK